MMNKEENKIRYFTDLYAWQEAHKLVLMVYKTTKTSQKNYHTPHKATHHTHPYVFLYHETHQLQPHQTYPLTPQHNPFSI